MVALLFVVPNEIARSFRWLFVLTFGTQTDMLARQKLSLFAGQASLGNFFYAKTLFWHIIWLVALSSPMSYIVHGFLFAPMEHEGNKL